VQVLIVLLLNILNACGKLAKAIAIPKIVAKIEIIVMLIQLAFTSHLI